MKSFLPMVRVLGIRETGDKQITWEKVNAKSLNNYYWILTKKANYLDCSKKGEEMWVDKDSNKTSKSKIYYKVRNKEERTSKLAYPFRIWPLFKTGLR